MPRLAREPSQTRPVARVVSARRRALRSPGTPLDGLTRTIMEPRLGHRFDQVRIHTDASAADAASAVDAYAFTLGENVVFGANRYQPGTRDGRHLLAHELTHVVQQRGGRTSIAAATPAGNSTDPDEREAVDAARSFQAQSAEVQTETASTDPDCPARTPGEVAASTASPGHLNPDVLQLDPGRLLVADFGVGSHRIRAEAQRERTLNDWLRTFEADATYRLRIVGYSDCLGSDSINTDLRQGRAQAVAGLLGPGARSRVSFVGMAALGSYVTDNRTVPHRARNRGAVIEFSQQISFPAETIIANPRHCGPESTDWLIRQMNTNKDHPVIRNYREIGWPNYVPFVNLGWTSGFLSDFRTLVRAGGPWDFKSNQQQWRSGGGRTCPSDTCDRTVTLCGRCYFYDVPGNIHYGWVGRMAGLRPWVLHAGASAVQAGGVDDPRDAAAIDIGIDMVDHGGALCDYIARLASRLNVDATGGCPACSTP